MLATTSIQKVRIRGDARQAASLRDTVARQLAGLDLRPPGMPPAAVLLVDRLADPLPGRVAADPAAVVADARWERAARARLDELHRRAARPEGGLVDEAAPAVLFADEAELCACVALALVATPAQPAWWLRAARRQLPGGSLASLLAGTALALPATLSILARWGREGAVLSALSADDVRTVWRQFAEVQQMAPALYALSLGAAPTAVPSRLTTAGVRDEDEGGAEDDGPAAATGLRRPAARGGQEAGPRSSSPTAVAPGPAPPWRPFWRSPVPLSPLAELLAGTAIALHQSPWTSRAAAFTASALRWWAVAAPPARARGTSPSAAARTPSRQSTPSRRSRDASAAPGTRASPGDAHAGASPRGEAGHAQARHDAGTPPAPVPPMPASDELRSSPPSPSLTPSPGMSRTDAPVPATDIERLFEEPHGGISVGAGGVLFLVNVLEALDLPACFEDQCELASTVGAWGTLEALGRALGPADDEALANDPVWDVIARLDGRSPGTPPRATGPHATTLRAPAAWMMDGAAAAPGAGVELPPLPGWPPSLLRWLAFVTPLVRRRLAAALDAGGGDPAAVDLGAALLRCAGQIHVTDTHVDFVTSVENVRLPLRMAGLDRSPGWVRSMQRVVLIHFE